jgi:hypothetical protein
MKKKNDFAWFAGDMQNFYFKWFLICVVNRNRISEEVRG